MNRRLAICGIVIWFGATAALRLWGQHILRSTRPSAILVLFAVSLVAMGWIVRRLCVRFSPEPRLWLGGALSVAAPTLLLDPFTSAFFPQVFPNISPTMAGVFGGWILCCCAGAFLGVTIKNPDLL
jgi:hypothetical protein